MKKKIYWGGIEYKYAKDHQQYDELDGGFVYVFFKAKDVRDFVIKIDNEFLKRKLEIKKIEFTSLYDTKTDWGNTQKNNHYDKLVNESYLSKEIIFDDFYAYRRG